VNDAPYRQSQSATAHVKSDGSFRASSRQHLITNPLGGSMSNHKLRERALDQSPVAPAEFQPALQAILATLADIDFAHEHEMEKINSSVMDERFKTKLVTKLDQLHREKREPYEQELVRLQDRMRSLLSRVPAGERSQ